MLSGLVSKQRRALFALLAIAVSAGVASFASIVHAGGYYTGIVKGVAVGGYDPVAYFTAGKPVKGSQKIQADWDGVSWWFSSEENRDTFLAAPANYAPKYGGYCAYAVALGEKAKGNPKNWKIVDGKLYLNLNSSIQRRWEKDQANYIKQSEKNWPKLSK